MVAPGPAVMLDDQAALWQKLAAHVIGPPEMELPFVKRLARENAWPLDHAERVITEYKRFCFLAVTSGTEVTPSDAVDQAWHLHLTYSRDYWGIFCPTVLGRPLHHGPTAGGAAERQRYFEQYAQTLLHYEQTFGPPPADIWPDAPQRFLRDSRGYRVQPYQVFIIPRYMAYSAAAGVAVIALIVGALL